MCQKLNNGKTPQQALESLMRLCAKSERSSGDALRLMYRWRVDPTRHKEVLDKLVEMRFIDDRRFAGAYVRDKLRFEGWGKRKIRTGLVAKGIDREIIESVIGEVRNDKEKLEKMLLVKMKTVKYETAYELKNKLIRFGLGRGFDYREVEDCINEIVNSGEDEF